MDRRPPCPPGPIHVEPFPTAGPVPVPLLPAMPGKFSLPRPHSSYGEFFLILCLPVATSERPLSPTPQRSLLVHLLHPSTISTSSRTHSTGLIISLFVSLTEMMALPFLHVFCRESLKFLSLKTWSLLPHPTILGRLCDLLWPSKGGERDHAPVQSLHLKNLI